MRFSNEQTSSDAQLNQVKSFITTREMSKCKWTQRATHWS